MNRHLTDKEIDRYISGLASSGESERVLEHTASCGRCRLKIESLSLIVKEQNPDILPGEHVKDRILAYWNRKNSEEPVKRPARFSGSKKIRSLLATAASVAIAFTAYFLVERLADKEQYPLQLAAYTGEVFTNSIRASQGDSIKEGTVIQTGAGSSALIISGNYRMTVSDSSSVEVSGNNTDSGIRFTLFKGRVISQSEDGPPYSFACLNYSITPSGTEFMLSLSGELLTVTVAQGKVTVESPLSRKEVTAGFKWSSGNSEETEPVDPETLTVISSGYPCITSKKDNSPGQANSNEEKQVKGRSESSKDSEQQHKAEKKERIKIENDLRNEMNEMKKELRRERNGKKRE